jgi:hypothetical protein
MENKMNPNKLNPIRPIATLAKFIGERLVGGGWSELPHPEPAEPKVPVRASITYIRTEEAA